MNKETRRRWLEQNPTKNAEYLRRYKKKHPERVKLCNQRWRQTHRKKARELCNRWRKTHPEYYRNRAVRYRIIAALRIAQYLLSHPCVDCGETNILLLEFDHVRGKKRYNVGSHCSWNKSFQEEIAKCDVRCSDCHRKRHWKLAFELRELVQNNDIPGLTKILNSYGLSPAILDLREA